MKPFKVSSLADDTITAPPDGGVYIAGGTTVVDLMKLDVLTPGRLVDLGPERARLRVLSVEPQRLRVGAMATMSELAAWPGLDDGHAAITEALVQAASPQIRNMATVGGNLLQRTRCSYFRDVASACNKRNPGSGCSAIGGETRTLAILGGSSHCIATYPGDLAVALLALDAALVVRGLDGTLRGLPVADLHRLPGDTPERDTELSDGDLIEAVEVPRFRFTASTYCKLRDRASYAFALASAAVALRLEDDLVADVRIVLGGVATRPWRCRGAEDGLRGRHLDLDQARATAARCLQGAAPDDKQMAKVEIATRVVTKALMTAQQRARSAAPAA